jgi:hypothetical protein
MKEYVYLKMEYVVVIALLATEKVPREHCNSTWLRMFFHVHPTRVARSTINQTLSIIRPGNFAFQATHRQRRDVRVDRVAL